MNTSTTKNAALYTLRDGVLEYNCTHSAPVAADAAVKGCGINNIARLELVMGKADMPLPTLSYKAGKRTLKFFVTADLTFNEKGEITDINVKNISRRPVVGISWKQNEIKADYENMAEILERSGAYAVYLPRITKEEGAAKVLGQLDGVLATGGVDINPAVYGEKQTPHGTQKCNDPRDISDLLLVRNAVRLDIPLLAICRGSQMLSAALGGKLVQDVPYYLGQKVQKGEISPSRVTRVLSGRVSPDDDAVADMGYVMWDENGQPAGATYDRETDTYMEGCGCKEGHLRVEIDGLCHSGGSGFHGDTTISKNSKWLYRINGGERLDLITTSHHQAVDPDRLGEGLTVAATSCDGIVEATEYRQNLFCLGVQYHPEKDSLRNHTEVEMNQDKCCEYFRTLTRYALLYSLL
ncbi:MAG: gamma-glutamyl-gamma-aminobutyrate hydrolase family protein [Oscillospiraceae bacterium]|nr:gamma-glutamyl-gamma-aminobutyrate hydrolase family protein [Oscillospiraceae bacterium]